MSWFIQHPATFVTTVASMADVVWGRLVSNWCWNGHLGLLWEDRLGLGWDLAVAVKLDLWKQYSFVLDALLNDLMVDG